MYISLDRTVGGDPVGAQGDMRSRGVLSVVFKIPKCTSHRGIGLVSRFERMRWRRAVSRERVEFSQTVHDTTAQSAYMIGLGIDAAKAQAGNPELAATLEATSRLSRSTIWDFRGCLNRGVACQTA